ncbi:LOW QUALITY PROTEIN: receptor-like protein 7 [Macadamia integrifolia]|uniref:LOW QUALITY PROTEIN: receptor-like protein 7 n=1 Tax=Macadamia integrifolia TaxID=60698 RepID=UPI001C4EC725|nr:LOW QUALITY PROTEIN: receptor-like protein 7 [Macadamia integrifolia]
MGIYLPFACLLLFLSFFYFFFLLLLLLPQIQAAQESHICLRDQKSALLQFRHEFIITDNISFSSWEPETDCCSWDGVTCNVTTGYVIRLDLNSKLSGPIHSNSSLFGLHHLQRLNLAYNDFNLAPIPSGFDRLPSLTHLNLSYSNFSGQIPWEFSRLTRLVSLDLSTFVNLDYFYYGYIWYFDSICHRFLKLERPNLKELIQNLTSLVELYLDGVDLSSPSPTQGSSDHWSQVLPQSLPNLRALSLINCGLSGPIHPSFSQLVFLEELRFDENYNPLEVPNFLPANFSHLKTLSLRDCGLYGEFPNSLFRLPNLQILDVSINLLLNGQLPDFPLNNAFQYISLYRTNFSGAIPDSIRNLRFLKTLRLGDLQLGGCHFSRLVSPFLTNLTQLTELDLSHNSFTGSVPVFNKDNVPNLTKLFLSNNLLDGTIHSSLFTLPSLYRLLLSNNQLTGRLDQLFHNSSLSSSSLEFMDLSGNKLNGQIPKSISQFSILNSQFSILNSQVFSPSLSSNDFSGTVKLEDMFGNLEDLFFLDLSNNNLLSLEFGNTSSSFRPLLYELRLGSCHIKEFPNFLRTQEHLWELDLSNNQIQGHVPSWIWKEGLLYLNLSYNSLNTLERPLLLNLSSSPLSTLDLRNNKLQGSLPIPASFVTFFSISNNSFVGEIPESICKLSDLQVFDASHNNLSGSIPECLGNISTLSVLDVQGNRFHGMPQNFTNASSLRTLKMNGNILEGQVPRSLANCTSLEVLDLGKHKIFDTFPFWLGKLPKLRVLVLHSNRFYGPIQHPRTLNEFPMLQIMDLSSNTFTGNFPVEYFQSLRAMMSKKGNKSEPQYIGNFYYTDSVTIMNKGQEMELVRILTIYTTLDLSNNRFQGEIPKMIEELTSLVVLNMSHNDLIGQIPSSIGNMEELESLDFSRNKLSGQIPRQLANLTFLEFLNLSQNHLEGPIPRGNQLETFLNTSYIENPRLCGFPLSRKCKDNSDDMPPQGEKSTNDSKFDWKFMLMGYGCSMVIGFVIGYIIFKDEWLIRIFRLAPIGQLRKSNGGRLRRR